MITFNNKVICAPTQTYDTALLGQNPQTVCSVKRM